VLEADAVDGVVQLDVHAQVVAVELELVAGAQAGVLVEVGASVATGPSKLQLPVAVLAGVGLVVDAGRRSWGLSGSGCKEVLVWVQRMSDAS
jgi:hypothetical protein